MDVRTGNALDGGLPAAAGGQMAGGNKPLVQLVAAGNLVLRLNVTAFRVVVALEMGSVWIFGKCALHSKGGHGQKRRGQGQSGRGKSDGLLNHNLLWLVITK